MKVITNLRTPGSIFVVKNPMKEIRFIDHRNNPFLEIYGDDRRPIVLFIECFYGVNQDLFSSLIRRIYYRYLVTVYDIKIAYFSNFLNSNDYSQQAFNEIPSKLLETVLPTLEEFPKLLIGHSTSAYNLLDINPDYSPGRILINPALEHVQGRSHLDNVSEKVHQWTGDMLIASASNDLRYGSQAKEFYNKVSKTKENVELYSYSGKHMDYNLNKLLEVYFELWSLN